MQRLQRPTVAVVGGGIAGLTAAHALNSTHAVTLYEAQDRVGGHAHSHEVGVGSQSLAVDSGFIVLNDRTYPNFQRLLKDLNVATRPTEMSMGIRCEQCGLSYVGGRGARGIFAQRRRALDPRFIRLLLEVKRFQKKALESLESSNADQTYGDFLTAHKFSDHFRSHYAIPVVACVWSMGTSEAMDYPALYLFRFLKNHGFLELKNAPTWHTVVGGSQAYVQALLTGLPAVVKDNPVLSVARTVSGVKVRTRDGVRTFDKIVLAAHADETLAILNDVTEEEERVLSAFKYSTNEVVLHRDTSVIPAKRSERASWNYRMAKCGEIVERPEVSYWMNRLQGHDEQYPLIVSLNPAPPPSKPDVLAQMSYTHPIYTRETVAMQDCLPSISTSTVAFAGAYHGWGFHEDGCRSGLEAAERLGSKW